MIAAAGLQVAAAVVWWNLDAPQDTGALAASYAISLLLGVLLATRPGADPGFAPGFAMRIAFVWFLLWGTVEYVVSADSTIVVVLFVERFLGHGLALALGYLVSAVRAGWRSVGRVALTVIHTLGSLSGIAALALYLTNS